MVTYVVGLDGSEHAHAALDWAQSTALADDSIVVAHAWDLPVTTGHEPGVVGVDPLVVEQVSEEFLDKAVAERADRRISSHLVTGNAGRSLVDLAEEIDGPATIVVGHGSSGKASLLIGSTANFVLHHTDVPVVVVRGENRIPVRRVVVGVDEGHDDAPDEPSLAALRWAINLPGVEEVLVFHADFVPAVAAGPVVEAGVESDEEIEEDDADLRLVIDRATDGTGQSPNGAVIIPTVASGTGAFALIEASRDVDLVVIGTRGRRGLIQLIVGSTGLEVTAHAHCPVAVVR